MKKLYNEFFCIPKHGKIREKVMLVHVAVTSILMIICLAVMSITAYAYLTYNVAYGSNTIKSANFETNVSINIIDPVTDSVSGSDLATVEILTSDHKTHMATLKAGSTYKVTLTPSADSTAKTGFCVISSADCEKKYHTQQLVNEVTFYLTVTATTQVEFLAHWGTSVYYADYLDKGDNNELYIIDGDKIEMTIAGVTSYASVSDGNAVNYAGVSDGDAVNYAGVSDGNAVTGTSDTTPETELTMDETNP